MPNRNSCRWPCGILPELLFDQIRQRAPEGIWEGQCFESPLGTTTVEHLPDGVISDCRRCLQYKPGPCRRQVLGESVGKNVVLFAALVGYKCL